MFNFWKILGFGCYFGFVSCSWATPGSRRVTNGSVRQCYSEMMKDSDISHLLLDVSSPERISQFCGRISFLKKCVAKFEHQLTNNENAVYLQNTQGISTFYLNVCPPGTDITEKYKKNAPCFQLIKTKILLCGSDLLDLSSHKMKNDLNARCCGLKKYRECMSWAAAEECGEEAEEVMEEILTRYFRPHLEGCRDSHIQSCQQDPQSGDSTPNDQGTTRDFYGENDHHSEDEDWTKTTVAEEWKRPRPKHSSGERLQVSFWSVFGNLVFLLLHFA